MGLLLSLVRGGGRDRTYGFAALAGPASSSPASRRPVPAFGGDEDDLEEGWVDAFVGEEGDDGPQAISLELSCTDAWPSASLRRASLPCRMALPEDTIAAEGWLASASPAKPAEWLASASPAKPAQLPPPPGLGAQAALEQKSAGRDGH